MKPWGNFWCDLCDVGAESVPPGWNRVKVTENLGRTAVAPCGYVPDYKMLFPKRIHISFPNLPSSPATAV